MNYGALATEVRELCAIGTQDALAQVFALLHEQTDFQTTKIIDTYLGTVENAEGVDAIHHHLLAGNPTQRNYCALYFVRRRQMAPVHRAYRLGLIDREQAYAK